MQLEALSSTDPNKLIRIKANAAGELLVAGISGGGTGTSATVKPYIKTVTANASNEPLPDGMREVTFAVSPASTTNATISAATGNLTVTPGMCVTINAGDTAFDPTYPITYTCLVASCTLLIVGSQEVAA